MIPPPPPAHLTLPSIDFETYSEAGFVWNAETNKWECLPHASQGKKGLPVVGAARYAEHPTCEVLTLSYDLLDGRGVRRWRPGEAPPHDLFDHIARGGLLAGWNTAFEHWIWNVVCTRKYGWPPLPQAQLRCTMARARAHAAPGQLGMAAKAMGWPEQKNEDGRRLLTKFSMPRNPTKKDPRVRIRVEDDPVDAENLYAYCDQDVVTEAGAAERLPELSPSELGFWLVDQAINYRGVQIDTRGMEDCIAVIEQAHEQYDAELNLLTGAAVEKSSQVQRFVSWLHDQSVHTDSLDEEHLDALLKTELPPVPRRALEIRQAVGSAAVKKVFAMRNCVTSKGRVHDLFAYHASHTGRATGNGVQPANFPNSGPAVHLCKSCGAYFGAHHAHCPACFVAAPPTSEVREWDYVAADFVLDLLRTRSLHLVEWYFGNAMAAVSGTLRGLFVPKPGHDFIGSDYSSIEAVGLAELAGEAWRQEVFRTHGKIYEMSAARTSGIPFEEFMTCAGYTSAQLNRDRWWEQKPGDKGKHHPLRKTLGKVGELASGYQGWIGAWTQFGADAFMNEEEIKQAILAWRAASPAIVEFWGGQHRREGYEWREEAYGLEGMAVLAVQNPGHVFSFRGHEFVVRGDALYLKLISGRELTYHRPRLGPGRYRGYSLSYEGWNTNPKNGPTGWIRKDTWGGRLCENICQATCRDLLMPALVRLEQNGYPVVLHVYDEVVCEVPEGFGSIEELESLMMAPNPWSSTWPVRASGGWRGKRYRKG